jgi:hypothetical protein
MPAISSSAAAASRQNGAHSHGPATAEGKARSALNSLAIGHRAKHFRLRADESAQEFAALRQSWIDDLEPDGVAELTKVEAIVQKQVMLARVERQIGVLEAWYAHLPEAGGSGDAIEHDRRLDWLLKLQERLERAADRAERAFLALRRARSLGRIGEPAPRSTAPARTRTPANQNASYEPGPPPPIALSAAETERAIRLLPLLDRIPTAEGRGQWLRGLPRQDQRLLERHLEHARDIGAVLPVHQSNALNVLSMIQ